MRVAVQTLTLVTWILLLPATALSQAVHYRTR